MPKHSLHKRERIKSRKLIAALFSTGKKLRQGPFLLIYDEVEEPLATAPVMFGVSVTKRKFKRAVDRNAIKRKIREVFRLSKNGLLTKLKGSDKSYALFVVYLGSDLGDFHQLNHAMDKLLIKWLNEIGKQNSQDQ